MSILPTLADRFEIEVLRGEFTDAAMVHDYDRFASLFTSDGAWRIPYANVELIGAHEIRSGIERAQAVWEYFVQTAHPGMTRLDGDTAVGRAYVSELGRFRDGRSQLHYAIYHDRYQRTQDGWKFAERVYEVRYVDITPLAGFGAGASRDAGRPLANATSGPPSSRTPLSDVPGPEAS
jgi:ketosteroid isomerase-like protein